MYIKLKRKQKGQEKELVQTQASLKKAKEVNLVQQSQIDQLTTDLNDSNKQNYFLKSILSDKDKNVA